MIKYIVYVKGIYGSAKEVDRFDDEISAENTSKTIPNSWVKMVSWQ